LSTAGHQVEHTTHRVGLLVFLLTFLGLVGVGRLAMEAWLNRPAPRELPEIGARTDKASPYLLVIIDGLRESSAWASDDPPMPWLQSFAAEGASGVGIAGEPTLTAPCVRALITGRRPDLLTGFRNFNARAVGGSVIEYLVDRGGRAGHGGDAAAYQFCRSFYADGDFLQFPDEGPTDQGENDAEAVPFVKTLIEKGCTVVTLHLTGPDHAGHKWGAVGREYWQACRVVDDHIKGVVEMFRAKHTDATVLIASDHGVSAMGTHGGGEVSAKRAPYALVGPNIARVTKEIDQCSLAPTVAMALGLPMTPLADAPPDPDLTSMHEGVERDALEAYVQSRLVVAADLRGDVVEVERARRSVKELGDKDAQQLLTLADDVNARINPSSAGHASIALLLGAFWLAVLVHLVSRSTVDVALGRISTAFCAVATLATFNPVPELVAISAMTSALLTFIACLLTLRAVGGRPLHGGALTLACRAAVPVLTGAGLTLQSAFEWADDTGPASLRMLIVLIAFATVLLAFLRPRAAAARLAGRSRVSPGLVAACGGSVLGFLLTLRPFIDPFLHLMIVYAVLGILIVIVLVFSRARGSTPAFARYGLLAVALVLFGGTRIAEGYAGKVWVEATEIRSPLWWAIGLLFSFVAVGLVLARGRPDRRDVTGLVLALIAWVFAYVARAWMGAPMVITIGANVMGLAALGAALWRGSPDGRWLVRMIAALALARRLSMSEAEFSAFALTAIGAALASHWRGPVTRTRIAWTAVAILALRTAIFHAMGFNESFSTLDVGQAFAGLEGGDTPALDSAGGAVVTWQVIVAAIQVALRMSLPWILILGAVVRVLQATPGAGPGMFRCLLMDLAVTFAARGAAIVTALWAWWRSSWWMTKAYTVYAFGAADVILLLVCATLVGAWGPKRASRRAEAGPVPAASWPDSA